MARAPRERGALVHSGQTDAHLRLFRVKLGGRALVKLSNVALNPTPSSVWPGFSVPFQLALVMVIRKPLWLEVPFQALGTVWPLAHCHRSCQLVSGVLRLLVMA